MEDNWIETIEYKGYNVEIFYDDFPFNPREDDSLGTMVCFHKKYNLGDKHNYNSKNYNNLDEVYSAIEKDINGGVILSLYLYDHSGITISVNPFSCPWDSGKIGFIYISYERIRSEYSCKRISKKLRKKVESYLMHEVEAYDNYLNGNCYAFRIKDSEGIIIDASGGYQGNSWDDSGLIENYQEIIDYWEKDKKEKELTNPAYNI